MGPIRLALVIPILLLAGGMQRLPLESPRPPVLVIDDSPRPAPFFKTDFAWSTEPGAGRIDGHLAFGGGRYSCAGAGVSLTPETPWVRERMRTLYSDAASVARPAAQAPRAVPEDYSAFVRSTTCDAQDQFSFQGLPAGVWYLTTVAHSTTPGAGEDMAVMRRVETVQGAINVDL